MASLGLQRFRWGSTKGRVVGKGDSSGSEPGSLQFRDHAARAARIAYFGGSFTVRSSALRSQPPRSAAAAYVSSRNICSSPSGSFDRRTAS